MTTITDKVLEPYYVSKDNHGYTIHEVITPDVKNLEEGSEGKNYIKAISHPSTFGGCLKRIAELKVNDGSEYTSIKEYLKQYKQIANEIEKSFNVEL
jgi:hypothetical protein